VLLLFVITNPSDYTMSKLLDEAEFQFYYRKSNYLVCDFYVVVGYTGDNKKWETTYFGVLGKLYEIEHTGP
jgi:hypothetical protein